MEFNIRKLKESIKYLEQLDLIGVEYDNLKEIVRERIKFTCKEYPLTIGGICYRARPHEKEQILPFNKIEEISYNPYPSKEYSRAHCPGQQVFYGSENKKSAVIEAALNRKDLINEHGIINLTLGQWSVEEDMTVDMMIHSKKATQNNSRLETANISFQEKMISKIPKDAQEPFNLVSEFISNQFAKNVTHHEQYKLCALFANSALKNTIRPISGIVYPSVGNSLEGLNIALSKDVVDLGKLILKEAYHVRCDFSNEVPKLDCISKSVGGNGNNILWE